MHYFLNSETHSCSDSFELGLQYLQTQDAKDYIAHQLWTLVQDSLGSDELDDEKEAIIKGYIDEFVTALPAVTIVLKEFHYKIQLCGSEWIWILNIFDIFLPNNKIAQFCIHTLQYACEKIAFPNWNTFYLEG